MSLWEICHAQTITLSWIYYLIRKRFLELLLQDVNVIFIGIDAFHAVKLFARPESWWMLPTELWKLATGESFAGCGMIYYFINCHIYDGLQPGTVQGVNENFDYSGAQRLASLATEERFGRRAEKEENLVSCLWRMPAGGYRCCLGDSVSVALIVYQLLWQWISCCDIVSAVVTVCISCCDSVSVAVLFLWLNALARMNLWKKVFILTYSSREYRVHQGGKKWQ